MISYMRYLKMKDLGMPESLMLELVQMMMLQKKGKTRTLELFYCLQ